MYAIVEIAGLQYKVERKQRVFVNRLEAKEGATIEFDKVLLIDNDGKITLGNPVVSGARVAAKVISHLKDDKVIVFKKKRRKGYQKWNNHRQPLTELLVLGVLNEGGKLSAEDAKLEIVSMKAHRAASLPKVTARVKKSADVPEVDATEEAAPKKAAKKPAAKKTAAKKAPAKKAAKKKED
jgi:large subunit ribosomal protein L21